MTLFDSTTWTGALLAVIGLAACQMDNPAFDEGQADEVGDSADTTSGDTSSGESSESGSTSSSDTDDTTDADDATSESSSDETAIEPDLPAEACQAEFGPPFSPIYGTPEAFAGQCPAVVTNQRLKVTGPGQLGGLLMAQPCDGDSCSSCDAESIPLGVVGLDDFSAPVVALVQNQAIICLEVQTGTYRGLDSGRCLYDSMWIGKDPEIDLLVVQHRTSPLPPAGSAALVGTPLPEFGQTQLHCSCDAIYEADDPNLGCCQDLGVVPSMSSLEFAGTDVLPPNSSPVSFNATNWTYHVAQAQYLPDCTDQIPVTAEISWAIVRTD
jgi:hypothetical protein